MDSAADTAAVALSAATTAHTLATRIWRQWEPRTARWRIGHVIAARLPSAPDGSSPRRNVCRKNYHTHTHPSRVVAWRARG